MVVNSFKTDVITKATLTMHMDYRPSVVCAVEPTFPQDSIRFVWDVWTEWEQQYWTIY